MKSGIESKAKGREKCANGQRVLPARITESVHRPTSAIRSPAASPDPNPEEVCRFPLQHLVRDILIHEPSVRVGLDPEAIHQMRVAIRRMRTALRVFADRLPVDRQLEAQGDLRKLGRLLGAVRDWDVCAERLAGISGVSEADVRIVREIGLDPRRHAAHTSMLKWLNSAAWPRLMRRLRSVARRQVVAADAPEQTAQYAERRLARELRKAVKAISAIKGSALLDDLHCLRIRVKRLRYAAELLAPLLRETPPDPVRLLRQMQNCIGRFLDTVLAIQMMVQIQSRRRVPDTLLKAAHRLEISLEPELEREFRAVRKTLQRAADGGFQRWCRYR